MTGTAAVAQTSSSGGLGAVRSATARFHSIAVAEQHGYALLTDAHKIACIDMPGMGWSDITPGASYTEPALRRAIVEFVKTLGLKDVTLAGESMGATVLNQEGKEVPIVMGSYGIGVDRIITAAIEQQHDEDGIIWPQSLAPFDVVVTITNMKQDDLREAGEKLYSDLQNAGLDVLLDDRDERAGVKFKDADLIGIPFRITVGKRVSEGLVELFDRKTRSSEHVTIENVVSQVQRHVSSNS